MAERYIEIDEGGFVDVETFSAPRSSHCSAAIQIAEHVVSQWNLHGRFRVTDEDRALWGGDEPDEVVMARSIIERHGRKTWDSVKEWMNDPCGHGTGGWNVRRFSLLSKVGGKDYIDVTPNEIVNVLIKRIAVSEYRVVTYDGLCDSDREMRDQIKSLADEWCRHSSNGMDVLASECLDEIESKVIAIRP